MPTRTTSGGAAKRMRRRRGGHRDDLRERDNIMTRIDCFFEVAGSWNRPPLGEACSDRALLYFIDMTIVHVGDV